MKHLRVATLVVIITVVSVAWAGAGRGWAGEPTDQLKAQLERVLRTIQDPEVKKGGRVAERRAVRKIAEDIFDFNDTAKRALGRHWAQRTPTEREEFVALFTDVFEHAYLSKVDLLQGERVTYLGDSIDAGTATVRTKLTTKQGSQLDVDYRMHKAPSGRWLVYDVLIENVSLVDNYRTQFNSVIQRSSYQELVRKLQAIQAQLHS